MVKKLLFWTTLLALTFGMHNCTQDSPKKEKLENIIVKESLKNPDTLKRKNTIYNQEIEKSFEIHIDTIYNQEIEKSFEQEQFLNINPSYKDTNKYNSWTKIDEGLDLIEIDSKLKSDLGNSKITVLKIDPKYYNFNLISSKEEKVYEKTAKEWEKTKDLVAVINAGMFMDGGTNVGYMKNYDFINGSLNKDKAILSFNPKDSTVPEIQIIDLENQNWDTLKNKYNSYTQSIRMIDYNQKNKWSSKQESKWSIASIGIDKEGKALFIFTRSPYSVHDFNNILLELPLNIHNVMYLEGGPEASFYLNHNGTEVERFGSYETNFNENDNNDTFWFLPNIIGITKK